MQTLEMNSIIGPFSQQDYDFIKRETTSVSKEKPSGWRLEKKLDQKEIKKRIDHIWKDMVEVLKDNPRKAIKGFIEYSKSANIDRFGYFNQYLLFFQSKGKARFVHTAKKWEKLGRKIKGGESPYVIVAYIPPWIDEFDHCRPLIMIPHLEYDVSQTEGEFIKEPTVMEADSGATEKLWEALLNYCGELNLDLVNRPLSFDPESINALGETDGKRLYLKRDISPTQRVRVLTHEIAHVLLHIPKQKRAAFIEPGDGKPPSKSVMEVEADAVACLVCGAWGIDVTELSKYYMMIFTDGKIRPGDISENIFNAVKTILDKCNPKRGVQKDSQLRKTRLIRLRS